MVLLKKHIVLFILLLSSVKPTIGQNTTDKLSKGDLEVRFLKDQVEVPENKSFFDILLIKNKTDKILTFNLQINVPKDWKIIGNSYEQLTLQAYAETSVPVRVSLSKHINGGVGYAVVAVISDEKGSVYNTVYAFVKIPVISKINIKIDKTSGYFNQKELKSNFELTLENLGNIDETVNIQFIPEKSLTVEKDHEQITTDNINVQSGSIQKIFYEVKLNKETDINKYRIHKLGININLRDSVIHKAIWFKYLDWKYKNEAPDIKHPLNLEFTAFNIFGNSDPVYIGRIYGNILLKNKKDLYYSFQNYNRKTDADIWTNSKIEMQFNTPSTIIFMGDYTGSFEHSMYGRGVYISQKIGKKNNIKAAFTKRIVKNTENYAASYTKDLSKPVTLEIGGVHSEDPDFNDKSNLGYGKFSVNFLKNSFSFLYGYSQSDFNRFPSNNTYTGWGYRAGFNGKIKNTTLNIRSEYGSPNYFGYSQGRQYSELLANSFIGKNKMISIQYFNHSYHPRIITDTEILTDRYTESQKIKTMFGYYTPNNVFIYAGPVINKENTNNFIYFDINDEFGTYTGMMEAGTRIHNKYTETSFTFSAKYGITSIYKFSYFLNGISYEGRLGETQYNVAQITAGLKQKNFGVHLIYHLGPYNVSQQFAYFYSLVYSKSLSIIPFYERDLLNKKLRLTLRGSYINNLESKSSRTNLNTGITWFAGKGFTVHFLNTSSFHRVNNDTGSDSFTSSYFEFGIKKSFDIQQPRLKYYDYQAIFYKDLNGNRIHDANEPGVPDILVNINRADPEKDLKNKNYNGEFLSNELYSNEEGKIEYDNIVEGDYIIKFTPKDAQNMHYESEGVEKRFTAKKDTVMYIPFMERNKLFGKINLHRSKHSALGEIPLDNIKITVEGNGKTYSALTDKDGYFELYIPVSDYYMVKVNNIFREHFKLRNESYMVKFNGYKQFELSFDFDEKERKIHFDENDFLITDEDEDNNNFSFEDIKVIRQTNLKGIIKDANSLMPLHAVVTVYNTKTNELISETASSRRTGVYFTSFFAGENYGIKVKAKGYWTYTEDLYINQITTFDNINKDILLQKIYIDEELKTENLKFKPESSELSPLAKAELDNLLGTLFLNPEVIIEIDGHVDDMEALMTDGRQLSKERAEAVANYLIKHGLSPKRVKIKALSNSDPKSNIDSPEGRARNRRVSIKIAGF
ncbi:MAG: OmpA family protein [Chlorobi bacterium]|nr:OmpA family protein [Chlorobiota bacterium]